MTNILKEVNFQCRVSSVLNKEVKQYGKSGMFDGELDSCWSSDQGSPQWIHLNFTEPVTVSSFSIQFQGGFVGQDCHVMLINEDKSTSEPFYPEDNNLLQHFKLSQSVQVKQLKFVFEKSTDFFGRIIVYDLLVMS